MYLICLMAKTAGLRVNELEENLTKVGHKKLLYYTTKEQDGKQSGADYWYVTDEEFQKLQAENKIISDYKIDDVHYGLSLPVGASRFVVQGNPQIYKDLKAKYNSQIIGVFVDVSLDSREGYLRQKGKTSDEILHQIELEDKEYSGLRGQVDVCVNGDKGGTGVLMDLLRAISERN